MQVNLGISGGPSSYDDDGFEAKYLNEIEPGDTMQGDVYVSELKETEFEGRSGNQFYMVIKDEYNKQKWVLGINTSYYPDTEQIYGSRGGRVYDLIDSLEAALNEGVRGRRKSYSVDFNTFRETMNDVIGKVYVRAVTSSKSTAKAPNIIVEKAELK